MEGPGKKHGTNTAAPSHRLECAGQFAQRSARANRLEAVGLSAPWASAGWQELALRELSLFVKLTDQSLQDDCRALTSSAFGRSVAGSSG
jgi:hypothetical protein